MVVNKPHVSKRKEEIFDTLLTDIYNNMKKQEEKTAWVSFLKLGVFLLICVNSIVLILFFKKFTKIQARKKMRKN